MTECVRVRQLVQRGLHIRSYVKFTVVIRIEPRLSLQSELAGEELVVTNGT